MTDQTVQERPRDEKPKRLAALRTQLRAIADDEDALVQLALTIDNANVERDGDSNDHEIQALWDVVSHLESGR